MVDQIEFANVVIISKVDLVSEAEVERIRGLVAKLNPEAICLTAKVSRGGAGAKLGG
jgi:G3E family GTPase